jgi:hypothetical protein
MSIAGIKFVALVNPPNVECRKFAVAQSEFVNTFSYFFTYKKLILPHSAIFDAYKCNFGAMLCGCIDIFPRKEGGTQVLAGLDPSSQT